MRLAERNNASGRSFATPDLKQSKSLNYYLTISFSFLIKYIGCTQLLSAIVTKPNRQLKAIYWAIFKHVILVYLGNDSIQILHNILEIKSSQNEFVLLVWN